MIEWWDKQIQRANQLVAESSGSRELLVFYAQLLRAQKEIYEFLRTRKDWLPSADIKRDLPVIGEAIPGLLKTVESYGPTTLGAEAHDLSEASSDVIGEMLVSYWSDPSELQFFAKAILQPYGRWLVECGTEPIRRQIVESESRCPFCGGKPQVSFLQSSEPNAESGNRNLICATCLYSWEFRRVVCAQCGEERPSKLGYFQSPEFDHVRIEACDTCQHYIKGVDLTRLGFASPLVDEIAAAPLDVWARAHGYVKIELNLVGL